MGQKLSHMAFSIYSEAIRGGECMSPSERRQALLEVLCRRRHDTYDNLAFEFAAKRSHLPVPQGQRGILWEWFGQPRQLPPPSVGIAPLVCRGWACILLCRGRATERSCRLRIRHDGCLELFGIVRSELPPESSKSFDWK